MTGLELKKGIFGYTKSSVYNYMAAQNIEFNTKLEDALNEQKNLMEELKNTKEELSKVFEERNNLVKDSEEMNSKISNLAEQNEKFIDENNILSQKVQELSKELNDARIQIENDKKEINVLKEEHEKHHINQIDIANVILEAQNFADNLKRQAENEYDHKKAENNQKITLERQRINNYVNSIDELCEAVRKACETFSNNVSNKKDELNYIHAKIDSMPDDNKSKTIRIS